MMRLHWTSAAAEDLQQISDYLKQHHPHYRYPTLRKLYDTIRSLNGFSGDGRKRHRGLKEQSTFYLSPRFVPKSPLRRPGGFLFRTAMLRNRFPESPPASGEEMGRTRFPKR
jgi:plasmid stabilization system protein ParE